MSKFNGFSGDYLGLTNDEVHKLQQELGKNELSVEKKETFLTKMLEIFKEPMFLLLFGTALIYFLLGEPKDGLIMIGFVLFMSGINIFQEYRTDKTLQALKELSAPKVRVIRNNQLESIESRELTVGDLMLLEEGDKISADGQIIEMFDLGTDESTLTGESDVVWKKLGSNNDNTASNFKRDYCYSGTTVTQGSAVVKVTSIGLHSEYGKIGAALLSAPSSPTPLELQTRKLIKICSLIGLSLCVVVFAISYFYSFNLVESLLKGITLAMSMIPEEFPVILTVFLAMGAWRLAKKNSLVRKMPSVETLGAVSVLCVDKTGTLTKNQMTVKDTFISEHISKEYFIDSAVLGCEIEPYDPMEKAILEFAAENGINKAEVFNKKLLKEYSFSSETKMMGHIWEVDGKPFLAAKGSPESILPLCGLNDIEFTTLKNKQEELAKKGYRVIAVAIKEAMPSIPKYLKENELTFLGFLGFIDPPREAVPNAIKVCKNAGIRVVMITGDNGITAGSIAKSIGIENSDNIITGEELEAMTDDTLMERVKDTNIFARVMPSHKMRIVKALKAIGEIVAMTGDGVNDATALKYADIGIAMGKRGTEVSKEAADMILLDDNFETIVDTVKDGRRIFDNIKKAVGYVFVIHIPIALIALLTPILKLPLLLLPIHVVLLELIIDPTCSIIFERQPAERNVMKRKPRKANEQIVSFHLLFKSLLQGFIIFLGAFGSYFILNKIGYSGEEARSFSLAVLIFANLFLVYVNQSENDLAVLSMLKCRDKVMLFVNLAILLALIFVIYTPIGNTIAKTIPLSSIELLCAFGIALVSTFWWEFVKLFKKIF